MSAAEKQAAELVFDVFYGYFDDVTVVVDVGRLDKDREPCITLKFTDEEEHCEWEMEFGGGDLDDVQRALSFAKDAIERRRKLFADISAEGG